MRKAWGLLSVARSALRYQSRLAAKDARVLTHMRELSAQYPAVRNATRIAVAAVEEKNS
jgi:hypothetical protein